MQGQLVQLDKQVWLLMTHYNHTYVHGLRVGAMVRSQTNNFFESSPIAVELLPFVEVPYQHLSCDSKSIQILQVAVRHAHIIALKSPSEKGLLLGACFRSHVRVVLYSALNTE